MKIYNLSKTQRLPVSLEKAWEFFCAPANLSLITPPQLNFIVTSENSEEKIFPGKIITYKVSPMLHIPLSWVTEITQVKDKEYFIDEQRFGPYAFWHHLHKFREIEGGVEMEDILHYALPFGVLGQIAHPILVKKKLTEIFDFRSQKLDELFGVF